MIEKILAGVMLASTAVIIWLYNRVKQLSVEVSEAKSKGRKQRRKTNATRSKNAKKNYHDLRDRYGRFRRGRKPGGRA